MLTLQVWLVRLVDSRRPVRVRGVATEYEFAKLERHLLLSGHRGNVGAHGMGKERKKKRSREEGKWGCGKAGRREDERAGVRSEGWKRCRQRGREGKTDISRA